MCNNIIMQNYSSLVIATVMNLTAVVHFQSLKKDTVNCLVQLVAHGTDHNDMLHQEFELHRLVVYFVLY